MKSGKILVYLLVVLAAAVVFYYLFWGDINRHLQMQRQQRFLDERIAEEQTKGLHLKKEQETLSRDPVQIEKVAREKLGLARPRDIIYRFEDKAPAAQVLQEKAKSKKE